LHPYAFNYTIQFSLYREKRASKLIPHRICLGMAQGICNPDPQGLDTAPELNPHSHPVHCVIPIDQWSHDLEVSETNGDDKPQDRPDNEPEHRVEGGLGPRHRER
jgi:hypothetical protein